VPRARPAEPLETYRGRRDFSRTPEPPPQVEKPAPGAPLGFVVQKHAARRLHWDFRLELGGVLKSWAVTRGPSADPADRRLAVRTEDHPVAYAGFEGRIPQGEYGGGTVMLWDRGRWHPRDPDPAAALDAGRLTFTLDGERMRGQWSLVRLRRKPGETRENWLLLKAPDAHAAPGLDLAQQHPTSIESGRSMAAIAGAVDAGRPKATRRRKIATALPAHRPPQLATLVDRPPAVATRAR
jgi:bifunctional non-homologous end joining protein LigD